MSFHDGAIDQIQAIARLGRQPIENALPDASAGPTVEPVISRCVRPVARRQITPRHSGAQHIKNGIYDLAVVNPRTPSALRQQRFEQRPFLIAQIQIA